MSRPALLSILCGVLIALVAGPAAAQTRPDPRPGAPKPAGSSGETAPTPLAAPAPPPGASPAPAPSAPAPAPTPSPSLSPTATPAPAPAVAAPAVAAPAPASAPAPAAPAPTKPAPGAPAAPAGAPAAPADDSFELKVRTLEENVNELKEKIFRTKARLLLLQETVLGGDLTAGAKAQLIHVNDIGASFVLESVSYALDGAPIFTRVDETGDLDKKKEIEIFNGRIVPGNHQISVKLQYRGSGFGVFSYLEAYKFKVQSSHTFNAEGGKVTTIKIVGYDKGNLTTDMKDRPAVKYDVEVTRDQAKRAAAGAEAAPAEGRPQ